MAPKVCGLDSLNAPMENNNVETNLSIIRAIEVRVAGRKSGEKLMPTRMSPPKYFHVSSTALVFVLIADVEDDSALVWLLFEDFLVGEVGPLDLDLDVSGSSVLRSS